MQNNLNEFDTEIKLNKQGNDNTGKDNIEYSTEQSEVQNEPFDQNEFSKDSFNESKKTKKQTDVFTPDVNKNKRSYLNQGQFESASNEPIDKRQRLVESEKKTKDKPSEFNDNKNRFENMEPFKTEESGEQKYIDNVTSNLKYAKDVATEKLAEVKDTLIDKYEQTKDKIDTKIIDLKETVKKEVKESDSDILSKLGLKDAVEERFPDLEEVYSKLDEIKINDKLAEINKAEEAIKELDKMPLDPSHLHDKLIDYPELHYLNDPLDQNIPESLKAENPDYLRAETLKELIALEDPDALHHEYLNEEEARECVEKAIDELDNMPKDPVFNKEDATEKLSSDQKYAEEDKMEDPNYKRAEAIVDIIEDKGPQYAEATSNKVINKKTNLENESNEYGWEDIKEKTSETFTKAKEGASKLWSNTKETLIDVEHKAEEKITQLKEGVRRAFTPDKKGSNDMTNNKGQLDESSKFDVDIKDLQEPKNVKDLNKPLFEGEEELIKSSHKTSKDSQSNMLSSNLEVGTQNTDTIGDDRLNPKTSTIDDIELKAKVGVPSLSQTYKYNESKVKETNNNE